MKSKILEALRESKDYVSGEMLSRELGISRVSIWKHISSLKRDGYVIEASSKGYCLISSPDLLLPYEFPGLGGKIHHFPEIGSTMDVARDLAKEMAGEGTIVAAEVQTQGKGRLGRGWISPKGGIYFTIILRPKISPAYAPRINLMASIAVAKAIRNLSGLKAELKWPNDVLIEGKKVCGILAEMEAETDIIKFVNVGIGINANAVITQRGVTSIKEQLWGEISRKELLSFILKEMKAQQALLTDEDLLREWRRLSGTLGREVRVIAPGEEIIGRAIDIDAKGELVIKERDGSVKVAVAGDCFHLS